MASLGFHGIVLLSAALLLTPETVPAPDEAIPVELWTPSQVEALTPPPPAPPPAGAALPGSGGNPQEPASSAPGPVASPPAEPAPPRPVTITATRMLSQSVLAQPLSRAMREALSTFDEETRIEQLCGIEAMAQISAALKAFHPDRVVAYAMAQTHMTQNRLVADGAAFRSVRQWYRLSFTCDLKPDRKSVRGFAFTVGDAIPRRLWEAHNLPPVY